MPERLRSLSSYLALVIASCGCTHGPVRYTSPSFYEKASAQVAVLPFDNESVDLRAPDLLREMVMRRLSVQGYVPLPVETVDEKLRGIGVTDGGQLRSVSSQKVGEALGVEGLFYGVIEDFNFINLGFAIRRVVRLRMRFVHALSGETLWEDTGEGVTQWATFSERAAKRAFAEGLAQRGIENALRVPLKAEASQAVQNAFTRLPAMSGAVAR